MACPSHVYFLLHLPPQAQLRSIKGTFSTDTCSASKFTVGMASTLGGHSDSVHSAHISAGLWPISLHISLLYWSFWQSILSGSKTDRISWIYLTSFPHPFSTLLCHTGRISLQQCPYHRSAPCVKLGVCDTFLEGESLSLLRHCLGSVSVCLLWDWIWEQTLAGASTGHSRWYIDFNQGCLAINGTLSPSGET